MDQRTGALARQSRRPGGRPPSGAWLRAAPATLAVAALLGAARLHAQTLPLPVVPPVPETAVPTVAPTQFWEYQFGVRAGYDTNVAFLPNGPGDEFLSPQGELARVFRGRRGRLRLGGSVNGYVHAKESEWTRVDAAAAVTAQQTLSESATLYAGAAAQLGHTDTNTLLADQGVLLPLVRTRAVQGSANVDWRVGARTTLRVDGRVYTTDFDDPSLVDSSSQRGSLSFARQLTGRASLSAHYAVERAQAGVSYLTQYASLQWGQVLSKRSALLFEGGGSHTGQAETSGLTATWNFYGGVSFAREVGRSRVVFYGRREVTPVFGIGGLQLADHFGLQATLPLGRSWQIDLTASRYIRDVPAGEEKERAKSDVVTISLQRSAAHRLIVGASAGYRHRGAVASTPAIDRVHAELILGFTSARYRAD